MGNILVKLVMYTLLLNIAGGLLLILVVTPSGYKVFDNADTSGYEFSQDNYSQYFISDMEKDISPSGSVEDSGDQVYRVLDTLNLGFMAKFFNLIGKFLYGFIDYLKLLLGNGLTDDVRVFLFGASGGVGALKIIVSIMYIISGIYLLTNKDVTA